MEIITAFFLGYLLNPFALVGLFIVSCLLSSRGSAFLATVFGGLAMTIVVRLFDVPFSYVLYAIPAYLVIGLVWGIWRYKRHVTKKTKDMGSMTASARNHLVRELHPKQMMGRIVGWTITWPFSVVGSMFEDFIAGIEHVIKEWLGGIYTAIFKQAEQEAQRLNMKDPLNENL